MTRPATAQGSGDVAEILRQAQVLHRQGRLQEAIAAYDRALAIDPKQINALNLRGNACLSLGRNAAALASYERVLELKPDFAGGWANRGIALRRLKRPREALASFDKALSIDPDHIAAINSRGNVLRDLDRAEEALACFDRVVAAKPDSASAWNNRAGALMDVGRHQEALADIERALSLSPDDPDARINLAITQIRFGNFEEGWKNYESRWRMKERERLRRDFREPLWLGQMDVAGKTVLLHAEQGNGDTIHFIRYAPLVAQKGARVVAEVQKGLKELVSRMDGIDAVVGQGEALPPFDFHTPLLSLPLAFRTTLDTIPGEVPYFRADERKVEEWRSRLGERAGLRVGLAWSGSPTQRSDARRSTRLRQLAPIYTIPGIQCVSLQLHLGDDDAEVLRTQPNILHPAADFDTTAAIMMHLDVVVAVDTSIAHLAGALARPVWVLLAYSADYRWLLGREDTDWYPSMRLFRQPAARDWESVTERVRGELMAMIGRAGARR